ncbi:MAG TPA: aminotransferase class V-fold PLP-dependent enzyme [Solirubrobacteraceae bacterium]|nr:aminotransferase class V-fold PLP-dependent enzyme [Solirubrobacteraceae bacterium]
MLDIAQLDASALREQFPILDRLAYLNAGTDGPLPDAAVRAAAQELRREAENGRTHLHFERRKELSRSLRTAYASILGCAAEDIALTTCTSEGLALVLEGLSLAPGDEILTSDEEHPGLLGALAAARQLRGVRVRQAPWTEIAAAVGPRTRLVACSHVSWMTGRHAPAALAALDVPVLLDGAQGVGAVPTDVRALRCAAYAGAGQKWLCGPDGTGMLYVSPELRSELAVGRRSYANFAPAPAGAAVDLQSLALHEDARRLDTYLLSAEVLAAALAAVEVLRAAGWDAIHTRARLLAAQLAEELSARGRELAVASPREREGATLVSFASADPVAERERLAARGVLLRDIPGRPWLRASVGAWNDEGDLARLLEALES